MNSLIPLSAALLGAALLPSETEAPSAVPLTALGTSKNVRPICVIEPLGPVFCEGDTTVVQLDGSNSYDLDGDPLTYLWQACPGTLIDDPTSATPTLTIDTSASCTLVCGVRFQVTDGEKFSYCRTFIEIIPDPNPDTMGPYLDIKPGSCPNPVNVRKHAPNLMARVAISLLGNNIDLGEVDQSTLRLRRVDGMGSEISPIQFNFSDTGTPYMGLNSCGCHALGSDGVIDLDLKFFKSDIIGAFLLQSEANNTYLELELIGDFLDGSSFSAKDCIRVLRHG